MCSPSLRGSADSVDVFSRAAVAVALLRSAESTFAQKADALSDTETFLISYPPSLSLIHI